MNKKAILAAAAAMTLSACTTPDFKNIRISALDRYGIKTGCYPEASGSMIGGQVGPLATDSSNRLSNLSCDDRMTIYAAAKMATASGVGTVVPWSTASGAQGNVVPTTPYRYMVSKEGRPMFCQAVMVNVTGGTLIAGTSTTDDYCEVPSGIALTEQELLTMPATN